MAARLQVEGVERLQQILDDLPVRNDRGRRRLIHEACRQIRTPLRREIRANIPRGRLRRSIRIGIGTQRNPFFRVIGRNYLVPFNAMNGAVSKRLDTVPNRVTGHILTLYDRYLRGG